MMVPVSLQTLVVLLSGMLLGPRLGAAAQTAYLMAGAAGLPVFAAGLGVAYLFGPTGGYLLAFPAAALTWRIAARGWSRTGPSAARRTHACWPGSSAGDWRAASSCTLGGWAQLAR
jgi:biotin transporter BioY